MSRRTLRTSLATALLGTSLLVAACGSSSPTTHTTRSSGSGAASVLISTAKGAAGTYIVGAAGRAAYLWVADSNGKSRCYGGCATNWPPLLTKATPRASGGVNAADLGTVTRSDGSKQVTYNGHPLYYYAGDGGGGTTYGQGSDGFGAKWWLVAPSGQAITQVTSSSSSSSGY
jgi:predicted lipoprotein with Yx(FWY)xxD motif